MIVNTLRVQELPERFCWTRFGTEAGQSAREILDRKEGERQANQGVFLWGIGNSVAPGISALVRYSDQPEVLFSPIKGAPRSVDVKPETVVAWTAAETATGDAYPLPPNSVVLSGHHALPEGRSHYALVCYSASPLSFEGPGGALTFGSLRNIGSGSPVGSSQVTAVVVRDRDAQGGGRVYPVTFRAALVWPYFIRLRRPVSRPEWTASLSG